MVWLRLVHIVAGIFWVGSAVFLALFLLPIARASGSEGGRFVARLMQRAGPAFGIAMLLTVIPGFVMYARMRAAFGQAWATSPSGFALGAGAIAAILAVAVGLAVNAPANGKIAALRKSLETTGGTATAAQTAQLASLQTRVERGAQLAALCLVVAAGAMAVARYL